MKQLWLVGSGPWRIIGLLFHLGPTLVSFRLWQSTIITCFWQIPTNQQPEIENLSVLNR